MYISLSLSKINDLNLAKFPKTEGVLAVIMTEDTAGCSHWLSWLSIRLLCGRAQV